MAPKCQLFTLNLFFLAISVRANAYVADGFFDDASQQVSDSVPFATMAELVRPEGYPFEEHIVQTQDGYLLSVYRIPAGLTVDSKLQQVGKPVVLLQHALLDCSASWVNNGGRASLAFILADAGFDVWMPNVRGNTFSRKHILWSPSDLEFWAFSWDEMAAYDLPASIDYILQTTGQSSLGYVGHSQGTTMGFAALSSQPQLAQKVNVAIMLAPVAFLGHITSQPIEAMVRMETDRMFELLGAKEFLPQRRAASDLYGKMCAQAPTFCLQAIEAICGYNDANINITRLPLYLSYTPAGTSVQNMVHWAQGVRRKVEDQPKFAKYDYGQACVDSFGNAQPCNQAMYGSEEPPVYDLKAIQTPLAIFSGGQDLLSDSRDIDALTNALPKEKVVEVLIEESYAHLDFVWGMDAHTLLYPSVKRLLTRYSGQYDSQWASA
ncbi:hypothetical protein ABBQ38_004935 [Trebouxia sp. C0009 RCD-2024]